SGSTKPDPRDLRQASSGRGAPLVDDATWLGGARDAAELVRTRRGVREVRLQLVRLQQTAHGDAYGRDGKTLRPAGVAAVAERAHQFLGRHGDAVRETAAVVVAGIETVEAGRRGGVGH